VFGFSSGVGDIPAWPCVWRSCVDPMKTEQRLDLEDDGTGDPA
jgi:hypothetical protein